MFIKLLINTVAWAQSLALKKTQEPGLNRVPVVDFKTVWKLFINQDQPLEAFLACCTLVNTGVWASTVPVETTWVRIT